MDSNYNNKKLFNEDEFHDIIDDTNNQLVQDISKQYIDLKKLQDYPLDEIRTCEEFRNHLRYISTIANLLLSAFDKATVNNNNNETNKFPKYALQQPPNTIENFYEENDVYAIKTILNDDQISDNEHPNNKNIMEYEKINDDNIFDGNDYANYDGNNDNEIDTDEIDCTCAELNKNHYCTNECCEADDRILMPVNVNDIREKQTEDESDEEQVYYSTEPFCYGYLERIDQTDDPDKTLINDESDINSASQLCYGYLVRVDPDQTDEKDDEIYGSSSNEQLIQPLTFQQIPNNESKDDNDNPVLLLTPISTSRVRVPQQKDLKLCINCKCAPGNCPVYSENMKMVCPVNCGCCQCTYEENINKNSYEPLQHCYCYKDDTEFDNDSKVSSIKACLCEDKNIDLCPCQDKRQDYIREHFYDDENFRAKAGANNENINSKKNPLNNQQSDIQNNIQNLSSDPIEEQIDISTSKINHFPEEEGEEYNKMSIDSSSYKIQSSSNRTNHTNEANLNKSSKKQNNQTKKNGTNRYSTKDRTKLYDIIGEKCLCKECPSDCKEPCHRSKIKPKRPSSTNKTNEIKKPLNRNDKSMKLNLQKCVCSPCSSDCKLPCSILKDDIKEEFDSLINKNIPYGFQEHLDDLNRKTISLENIIKNMTRDDKLNDLDIKKNESKEICIELPPPSTTYNIYNNSNPSNSNNKSNEQKQKNEDDLIWYSLVPKNDKNVQEDIEILPDNYPLQQLENIKNQSTVHTQHNGEAYEIILRTVQNNDKTKSLTPALENSFTQNEQNLSNKNTLSLNLGDDINIIISKSPIANNNSNPQQQADSNVQSSIPPIQTAGPSTPRNQSAPGMQMGQNPFMPVCLPCIPTCCNIGLNPCLCAHHNLFNQCGSPQGPLLQNAFMQPSAPFPEQGSAGPFQSFVPTAGATGRPFYPTVMEQNVPHSSGVQQPGQDPMSIQNSQGSWERGMMVQNFYNPAPHGAQLAHDPQREYSNAMTSEGIQLPNDPQREYSNAMASENAYYSPVTAQQFPHPNSLQQPAQGRVQNMYNPAQLGVQLPNELQREYSNAMTSEGVPLPNEAQRQYSNAMPLENTYYPHLIQQNMSHPSGSWENGRMLHNSYNPGVLDQNVPQPGTSNDRSGAQFYTVPFPEGVQLPNGSQQPYPHSNPSRDSPSNISALGQRITFGSQKLYTFGPDTSQSSQDKRFEETQNRSASGLLINEQETQLSNISDIKFQNQQVPQIHPLPSVNEQNEQNVSNNNALNEENLYEPPQTIDSSTQIEENQGNLDTEQNHEFSSGSFQNQQNTSDSLQEGADRNVDPPARNISNEFYANSPEGSIRLSVIVGSPEFEGVIPIPDPSQQSKDGNSANSKEEATSYEHLNSTKETVPLSSDLNITINEISKESNDNKLNENIEGTSSADIEKQIDYTVIQTVSSSVQTNELDSPQEKISDKVPSSRQNSTGCNKQFKDEKQRRSSNDQNINNKDDEVLKVFVQSLFCNLKEMHNIMSRDKSDTVKRFSSRIPKLPAGFQALPPSLPPVCQCNQKFERPSNSYPVQINSVRPLGQCSLIVKWSVHDMNNVIGYEVCIDDIITNRYYSPSHTSALIYGVDLNTKHMIVVAATTNKKKSFLGFLDKLYSPTNDTSREWIPSSYIYSPY